MRHVNNLMAIVTINEYKINPEMYFKLLDILKINYNNFAV